MAARRTTQTRPTRRRGFPSTRRRRYRAPTMSRVLMDLTRRRAAGWSTRPGTLVYFWHPIRDAAALAHPVCRHVPRPLWCDGRGILWRPRV